MGKAVKVLCPIEIRSNCKYFKSLISSTRKQSKYDLLSIGLAVVYWFILGNNVHNNEWFASLAIYATSFLPFMALFNRTIPRDRFFNGLIIAFCAIALTVSTLGSSGAINIRYDLVVQTSGNYTIPNYPFCNTQQIWYACLVPIFLCVVQWVTMYSRVFMDYIRSGVKESANSADIEL